MGRAEGLPNDQGRVRQQALQVQPGRDGGGWEGLSPAPQAVLTVLTHLQHAHQSEVIDLGQGLLQGSGASALSLDHSHTPSIPPPSETPAFGHRLQQVWHLPASATSTAAGQGQLWLAPKCDVATVVEWTAIASNKSGDGDPAWLGGGPLPEKGLPGGRGLIPMKPMEQPQRSLGLSLAALGARPSPSLPHTRGTVHLYCKLLSLGTVCYTASL